LMYFRIARSIEPNAYQEKMPGARDEIQNLIWYDSNRRRSVVFGRRCEGLASQSLVLVIPKTFRP